MRGQPHNTKQRKQKFMMALVQSLGVVHPACIDADVPRATYSMWMKKDPEFAAAVREVQEIALDFAETSLHDQIRSGNTNATIFYLKTKGKHRGFTERIDVNTNKNEVEVLIEDGGVPSWMKIPKAVEIMRIPQSAGEDVDYVDAKIEENLENESNEQEL